jgi:hypothetical protein
VIQDPITRSRAKKLQQEVNYFLAEINFKIYDNVILPKVVLLLSLGIYMKKTVQINMEK